MRILENIMDFFDGMKETMLQGLMIAVIAVCFLLIIVIVFKAAKGRKEGFASFIFVVFSSCILMIPATLASSTLVKIGVRKAIKNVAEAELKNIKLEIQNKQLEKENLEKQNKIIVQELEMNSLNKQLNLLKASQVSAMQFKSIAEIALIKTNIQQTKVWHEPVSEVTTGWGLMADYYRDNILVVNTYDIDAKFGIDFNKIKIKKINNDKILVTGIEPTYIGASKNIKDAQIKEIRRYDYNKDRILKRVSIKDDNASVNLADQLANELDKEYQNSLKNMENWSYLTDAIVSLGQNFVKMIFGAVYSEIEFSDNLDDDFLPMKDYISKEIELNTKRSIELSDLLPKIIDSELKQNEEVQSENIKEEQNIQNQGA